MSVLAPWYLLLAAAAAIPLLVHLRRRRRGATVEFPAVRYLVRAQREHRRTLRLRNLLLMLLRVAIVLLLALAAARPVGRRMGGGHAPTAIAILLDNSLSTTVVLDGRTLLDRFRHEALAILAQATEDDRIVLVTADGAVLGGTAAVVRAGIGRVAPLAGAGDLADALRRAAGSEGATGLDGRRVVALTDAQRTAWSRSVATPNADLLVCTPSAGQPPANRAVIAAEAVPARWTPRGQISGRFLAADSVAYRVTLRGTTLARGSAAPGEEIQLRAAPPERGWLSGTVEIGPDELPGDNVRHFAVWIGAARAVRVSPGAGPFLAGAVEALVSAGRITTGADVAVVAADELTTLPALIVAPSDVVRAGAANRALARAGVQWRFGARRGESARATGDRLDSAGVSVTERYELLAQPGTAADTLARVGAEPWIVAEPRYALLASPVRPEATTLPIRAAFAPWLDRLLAERLAGGPSALIAAEPGIRIRRPAWVDAVEGPDGTRDVSGDSIYAPREPGVSFLLEHGRRAGALVVNAPAAESDLTRMTSGELTARLRAASVAIAADSASCAALAFRAGPRGSWMTPFLTGALLLLVGETALLVSRRRAPTD